MPGPLVTREASSRGLRHHSSKSAWRYRCSRLLSCSALDGSGLDVLR